MATVDEKIKLSGWVWAKIDSWEVGDVTNVAGVNEIILEEANLG